MAKRLSLWWQRNGIASAIILAVVLLTYGPLYLADYAITDDYAYMLAGDGAGDANVYLADGRPVYYLMQVYVQNHVRDIQQLKWFRFGCIVFTAVLAIVFYHLAKHVGGSKLERSAFAIALAALPSLHDPLAMALLWLTPLASLAACFAAVQTRRVFSQRSGVPVPYWKLICPLLLMLACGALYQSMLAFYWSVVLLFVLDPRFLRSQAYRRTIAAVVILGFVYFACCFVSMKAYIMASGVTAHSRTGLADNPLEKIYWFLRIQLPLALNYWQLMISGTRLLPLATATITGGILAYGYFAYGSRIYKKSACNSPIVESPRRLLLLHLALVGMLILLSHVHWLAMKQLPQSYRILGPLGVSVWILMFWAVRQIINRHLPRVSRVRFRSAMMTAIAFSAIFVCQKHSELIASSNSLAYRYVLYCLRDGLQARHDSIHVILQGQEDGVVEQYYIECFGRPPAEAYWTIKHWMKVALRELNLLNQVQNITYSDTASIVLLEDSTSKENTLTIDMRKLKLFRTGGNQSSELRQAQ
jgi:hypothetical protein